VHLNGGVARTGARVLSDGAVRAMREPQNALPASGGADHFGLGWMLFDWGGHRLFGHDGVSVFQRSYLRVLPEQRAVFSLLTNGGDGVGLYRELAGSFFGEMGVALPPTPKAAADARIDVAAYAGKYVRFGSESVVEATDGRLAMTTAWTADWARTLYGTHMGPFALEPAGNDLFRWHTPGVEPGLVQFVDRDDSGRFKSLYSGVRLSHRQ
jgi:hypothetical protein